MERAQDPAGDIRAGEENLEIVRSYLAAIERAAPFEELRELLSEDIVQREFPNRLLPNGATRGLAEIAEAAARGTSVMSRQRYEILSAVALRDRVALEVLWVGTLAVPFQSLPAGGEMRARFAVFFVVRDGRIQVQHNYDCFDPW